ncbi:MAG: SH3 domain-containing protein [Lachnospiraceae bacterium]|nr:SH3 domain-containing protein [Lachnospiraceae bacterium]
MVLTMVCAGLVMTACASKESKAPADEKEDLAVETIELGSEEALEAEVPEEAPLPEPEPVPEPIPETEDIPEPVAEAPEEAAPESDTGEGYTVESIAETKMYATETVNIRKGPSKDDYDSVGKLKGNAEVTADGKVSGYKGDGSTWYRIKRDNGEAGFVKADYLTAEKPADASDATVVTVGDAASQPAAQDAAAQLLAQQQAAAAAAAQQQQAAAAAAAQQQQQTPVVVGGTHNLNGLMVNEQEYQYLLSRWRFAVNDGNGTDQQVEEVVLHHSAGDLETILKAAGYR